MSLRWRLALVVGVIAALAIAAAGTASYLSTRAELRDATADFLRVRAGEFVNAQRPPDRGDERRRGGPGVPPARPAAPPLPRTVDEPDAVTQVLRDDGAVRTSGIPPLPVDARDRRIAASREGGPAAVRSAPIRTVDVDGEPIAMITAPFPRGGAVQVGRRIAESNQVLASLRTRLLLVGAVGTAAAVVLAWLVAVGVSRPIRQLGDAAERVAETRDLDTRIQVRRRDEVGRLARSFNTMLEALDTSRRQQRQLVADASHELRTPLTSLRTNIELLDRLEELDDPDRSRLLADVTFEIEQLAALVDELVESASEIDPAASARTEIELDRLVRRAAHRMERRTGRAIRVDAASVSTEGSPDLIERAVTNILGNAAKFSPPGSPIELLLREGDEIEIAVRDHGPGVPEEELDAIFDRFHRAPAARDAPGSGLGLAIVRQIASVPGGRVAAAPAAGGGLVVTIYLPGTPGGGAASVPGS